MRVLKSLGWWIADGNTFEEDDLIERLFSLLKAAGFDVRLTYTGDHSITSTSEKDEALLDMQFIALKAQSSTPYYS